MLLFLPIMQCSSSLLKFAYYAQYYEQEKGLWSKSYAIYIQVYLSKLLATCS